MRQSLAQCSRRVVVVDYQSTTVGLEALEDRALLKQGDLTESVGLCPYRQSDYGRRVAPVTIVA